MRKALFRTVAPVLPAWLGLAGLVRLTAAEPDFAALRKQMAEVQLAARDITNQRVLQVMGAVSRHELVPTEIRRQAYADQPLPIGHGQTISQPYIVAFMTQALEPATNDVVLEIGTGSGYQAAVLAGLVRQVCTIEIVEPLARRAESDLKRLGFTNVNVRAGDGYKGWPEAAPFDAVIVTDDNSGRSGTRSIPLPAPQARRQNPAPGRAPGALRADDRPGDRVEALTEPAAGSRLVRGPGLFAHFLLLFHCFAEPRRYSPTRIDQTFRTAEL